MYSHREPYTMLELKKILAFCSKPANLTLSSIIIMDCVQAGKILQNNISPSNILLHDHVDRVYIGVCDWGLASCIVEDTPSMYGFPTMVEMERNKSEHYWVALELFYVYNLPNS